MGCALAEMGLDLWFLAGVGLDDARRLCEHLDSHYQLEYVLLPLRVEAGPPLTVLHRRSAAFAVEPIGAAGSPAVSVGPRPARHGHDLTIALQPAPNADAPGAWLGALPLGLAGLPSDPVLMSLGHRLDPADLDALTAAGYPARLAASGPDGSLVMLDSGPSRVERVFLSPNLTLLPDAPVELVVSIDRELPPSTQSVAPHAPLAVRLVFGPSPPPTLPSSLAQNEPRVPARNEPETPSRALDTDLERALTNLLSPIIARLVAEARRQRPHEPVEGDPL